MKAQAKIDSAEYSDLNRVVSWYIALRWMACAGVLLTLLAAKGFFHLHQSFTFLYVLNGFLALMNLGFLLYYTEMKDRNLSRREMSGFLHAQVCCDYIILFLFIYRTGFLENPFAYFFVFHIMLTSFVFSSRAVYMYACTLVVVFCATAFGQAYRLLPYFPMGLTAEGGTYHEYLFVRLAGVATTLIFAAYLITNIKSHIEERGKSVAMELDRYRSLDKVKSDFILQVTHELRGPLAALKGYHEMMLKGITGEISEKTEEALHRADVRTQNLLNIIDEMIDYAYMQSGEGIKLDTSEINLRQAIKKNVELFRLQAAQKSIGLSFSCPSNITLLANADLLDIVFSNLITNAIRYSGNGTAVNITATEDKTMAHVQVKDQGMGMSPDELNMIFDEFFRSRRAREVERDGTGLGLSIVKRVVDALTGKITVYSEENKGTNFHVFLPLA